MRARERIQKEVDEILAFKNQEDWEKKLAKAGKAHSFYYHYTTLKTLQAMIDSSKWMLRRADYSNDPNESTIHNASFTTSSISSMGMWKMYAKMGEENNEEIGIRIGLSRELLIDIFGKDNWEAKNPKGIYVPKKSEDKLHIYDIAYWHFGKTQETDLVYYKNYELIGHSLKWHQPKDKQLPSFFKGAIWRSEKEVRVCRSFPEEIGDLYVPVTLEQFRQMSFWLAPDVKTWILKRHHLENYFSVKQFHLLGEQEEYQSN